MRIIGAFSSPQTVYNETRDTLNRVAAAMLSREEYAIRQRLTIKGYLILELRLVTIDHRVVYRLILADPEAPDGKRLVQDAYPRILQKIGRLPAR